MTLNLYPSFPGGRRYVLKLHRDAWPVCGRLAGRIENISTGRVFNFDNCEELMSVIGQDLGLPPEDRSTREEKLS